jgi:hypothetical protein
MTGIRSRKTLYRNTIFRSSLEAEWAAFFDLHDVAWDYEPQTFTDGISWYLPDFFLPYCRLRNYSTIGVWLEIKPNQYINGVRTFDLFKKKHELMSTVPSINFCVFFGHPTIETQSDTHEGYQIYPWYDNYMRFMKCPHCGTVKIEFDESNYNNCSICGTQSKTIMGYS